MIQHAAGNWWENKKLTATEKNELLIETCRRVFSTEEGRIVLNMLLDDLHYFFDLTECDPSQYERACALNEYAKFFIRRRLGVDDTKALTDRIIETAVSGKE